MSKKRKISKETRKSIKATLAQALIDFLIGLVLLLIDKYLN